VYLVDYILVFIVLGGTRYFDSDSLGQTIHYEEVQNMVLGFCWAFGDLRPGSH